MKMASYRVYIFMIQSEVSICHLKSHTEGVV